MEDKDLIAESTEITDPTVEKSDEYEGDDAYADNAEDMAESDVSIMFPTRRKSGFSHYAHESFLLNFFKTVIMVIIQTVRNSFFFKFMTDNSFTKKHCQNSRFYDFFKSDKATLASLKFKNKVIAQISQSRILSGKDEMGSTLLRAPLRCLSVFIISTGVTTVGLYFANLYYLNNYNVPASQLFIGVVMTVVALLLLTFNGTLAELVRSSVVLRIIIFGFFGVTIKLNDETPIKVSYSKIAVIGIITGIISLVIPLYQIIIALAIFLCAVIILKSPESGILLIIATIPLLALEFVCALIIAVWASFALKFFSGKRVIRYEYIDIFPAIITFILLLGGIFSLGNDGVISLLPAALSSLYFLIVGLIRDRVWADRCRVTFTIGAVVASIYAVLRVIPENPFNLGMIMYPASDLGARTDAVLEHSGVLALFLAMIFFLQLADFYARRKPAEKFGSFILSVFFAVAAFLVMEERAAIVFTVLALIAITVLSKGLRFLIPITAFFFIIMPIFGLPSVLDILGETYVDINARLPLWQESFNILNVFDGKVALFGIGNRPDAFAQLYTGNINDTDPQNLVIHTLVSLGIPATVFIGTAIFFVYKYCLAHGHKCSDKKVSSRLRTYGCLFSVSYVFLLGLTENTLYNYRCAAFFWLFLGFAALIQRYSYSDIAQEYENDYTLIPEI